MIENDGVGDDEGRLGHGVRGNDRPFMVARDAVDEKDEFEKWLSQNLYTVEPEFWPNLQAIYDKYKALKSQR